MRYQEFLGLRTDRVPVLVETANDIDIARFRRKPVRIRKLVLAPFSAKVSVRSRARVRHLPLYSSWPTTSMTPSGQ
jgi:hypothetical protein